MRWRAWLVGVATLILTLTGICVQPALAASGSTNTLAPGPTATAVNTTGSEANPLATTANNTASSGASTSPDATAEAEAKRQLDDLPTQSIDDFWRSLQQQYGGYLPNTPGNGLIQTMLSGGGVQWNSFFSGILRFFLSELVDNAQLLGAILVLAVLSAVLGSIQAAFEEQTVSQVANAMIFLVLMLLAIGSFTEAIGYARHAIQSMTDFMLTTVPVVITLLAASGAPASAAFFHPLLLFFVHLISNVVLLVVFPLIFFSALLDLASTLSPRYKLTRLAGLLRTTGAGVLGVALSAFIGVASVQGLGKGIADGVALRTAKFAVSTFVPVVGKAFSDAATTVASASLLVKDAVGIASLVVVVCLALFPALKILALSFIYSGSAALMQPLGENTMIACLGTISKSLVLVFASVAVVALMFFLSVSILLVSTNMAVMMQ